MEGDEMEMSKEELQKWIREKVKKNKLISTDVLEKCNLLQSLLERREKQTAHFLKLCESVAACEAIVKKQYSLLGWEYRDTDSDDDDNKTGCENTPPAPCDFVDAETQVPSSSATNGPTRLLPKLQDSENLDRDEDKNISILLKREPVVVLTRLPLCKISSLRPPTPQNHYSEDESLNNSDSDVQWEPEDDSSDSDYSISSFNTGSNKRRKLDEKNEKPQASTNSNAKINAKKTSTLKANGNTNARKTLTPPTNTNGVTPVCIITALCQSTDKATKTHPGVSHREISVNMNVLARTRAMGWQQGKIMEMVTKEDGKLKYKISFEDKGKSLISGHHIAFDCMPKVEQLFVGARVVVKCQADQPRFCPGILAELPSRKNRMRFLVFLDDHTPVYVGLPLLHLVCRPLTDPLDDIPDGTHKDFLKDYIKAWPFPLQTQYRVGQIINAQLKGVQQTCEVLVVDCSLIQVVFQKDQHKEWIYRGSLRLRHMTEMIGNMELKKEAGQKNKSDQVNESSKSAH